MTLLPYPERDVAALSLAHPGYQILMRQADGQPPVWYARPGELPVSDTTGTRPWWVGSGALRCGREFRDLMA